MRPERHDRTDDGAPQDLLERASELARRIGEIERDIEAQRLAKLLGMPKQKASEQVARMPEPAPVPAVRPLDAAAAAAQIAQLEARARAVLERRRRQLAQQRDGARLTASFARGGGTRPVHAGQEGARMPTTAKIGMPAEHGTRATNRAS